MQDLPQCLLLLVLKRVDQADRLTCCALVSTAWAEAAAMATDVVECRTSNAKLVTPWLDKHGPYVTRILWDNHCQEEDHRTNQGYDYFLQKPSSCSVPVLSTLPCSNLLQLSLYGCSIMIATGWGESLLETATRLTYLDLHMRNLQDFKPLGCIDSLLGLRDLENLEHLDLSVDEAATDLLHRRPNLGWNDQIPSYVIRCWSTNLTSLRISGVLALDSFQAVGGFTKLRHLYLDLRLGAWDCRDITFRKTEDIAGSIQAPFQQLQELTFLSLCMEERERFTTHISMPSLAGCSGLQELYLYSPTVDVSSFQELTGLRTLHLVADAVFEGGAASSGNGIAAVFEHIGRMQQLERLVVAGGFLGTTVALDAVDAELCVGLTASAHLTHLDLRGLQLPCSAWGHLFPFGRQLLQLPEFRLQFVDDPGVLLDDCALAQLAACCPAFPRLSLEYMSLFRPGVSLVPLLQLRQLVDLECHSVADGDASVGVLACMSSLTRLHVRASEDLTDGGLMQLTALIGLHELTVDGDARWYRNLTICKYGAMELKATCVSDPDVWYQLLLACVPAPQCQTLLNQQLPRIIQQLQDSDYGTTTFELAREVARALAHRKKVQAEVDAAMLRENTAVTQAQQQLQEQLKATGVPCTVMYEAHECGECFCESIN